MEAAIWKESFRIGIPQVDEQHRQLIRQLNKLQAAMQLADSAQRKREIIDILAFLQYYAILHFSTEEHVQEEMGFHDRARHKQLHAEFTKRVDAFTLALQEVDYAVEDVRLLTDYLENWLVYHIVGEDKRMVPGAGTNIDY